MTLLVTMFTLVALHGLFLAGFLAFERSHQLRSRWVLAGLLAAVSLILLDRAAKGSGLLRNYPALRGLAVPFWYLIGPLLNSYVRRFFGRPLSRLELALYAPFAFWLVRLLPVFVLQAAHKLPRDWWVSTPIHFGLIISYEVVTLAALALAARATWGVGQATVEDRSDLDPWSVRWLRNLVAALLVVLLLESVGSAAILLGGTYPNWLQNTTVLTLAVLVYLVGHMVLLRPRSLLEALPEREVKYEKSAAGDREVAECVERLEAVMEEEQAYLAGDLGLDDLASRIGVSRHHLSQAINQGLQMSFYDYVNRRRIEHAKRLLVERGRSNVLDVAFEVGFGSGATFYRAFKRHAGKTPREYIAETRVAH